MKIIPFGDFQRSYQKWEQRLHICVATPNGTSLKGITCMFEQIKTFYIFCIL